MHRFTHRSRPVAARALVLLVATAAAAAAQAAAPPLKDTPGAKDHALVTRFPGSVLVGYHHGDWEQTQFPISRDLDREQKFVKPATVEGAVTRLWYLGPVGKSPLEVFRSYQQAFTAAGLKVKFACNLDCGMLHFRWLYETRGSATWTEGDIAAADGSSGRWNVEDVLGSDEGRGFYGTLAQGGREVHVWVYTAVAAYPQTKASGTVIEIAEPKAMQSGQVTVDANAIGKGLAADGHVALYGVYFDTGKATLKAESDAQLAEMAKLLTAQPKLQVYVVGHTDNQGAFDANLALSKARAEAVRDALVGRHKVAAARIVPQGVANLAPVASNADDAGRARNRRVELVVR